MKPTSDQWVTYDELSWRRDEQDVEDLARELGAYLACYAATGGLMVAGQGALLDSPIYRHVTLDLYRKSIEQKWKQPFSSCAYLCHWVLECLGLYVVRGIGRTGRADNPLSRLAYHRLSEPMGAKTKAWPFGAVYESCDILQIGDGGRAHVFVALANNRPAELESVDEPRGVLGAHYGQEGLRDAEKRPLGGVVKMLPIRHAAAGGQLMFGERRGYRALRLCALLEDTKELGSLFVPKPLREWIVDNRLASPELVAALTA